MNKVLLLVIALITLHTHEILAVRPRPVCDIMYSNADGDDDKVRELSTIKSSPARNEKILGQEGIIIRISDSKSFLLCSAFRDDSELTEISYEILTMRDNSDQGANIVGNIEVQFYPESHELRLRHIEVDEKHRRQKCAMRALESLFADLRRRDEFKVPRKIYLEVSIENEAAISLYKKFGFTPEGSNVLDVMKMSVFSNKIKFPLFKKK